MSNQTGYKIDFKYLDLENCFKNFYVVPDYQREFVWEERQVTQLLSDIYEEYSTSNQKEYFIGSVVVFKRNDGIYEVIDGQQRLTTLFLLICAYKKIYNRLNEKTSLLEKMIKDQTVNDKGDEIDRFKLELQYEDSTDILVKLASGIEQDGSLLGSAKRINEAFNNIIKFIEIEISNEIKELKLFFTYLYRKVKFMQLETPEINDALKIFETINERGVGLNPMDLLKNLIFRQVKRDKFNSLKSEWKKVIEILERYNEKPLRFLRYFIMANFKVKNARGEEVVREDEIYSWITANDNKKQCNYEKDPMGFVRLLYDNALCYVKFFNGEDMLGKNVYLNNIHKLGGGAFRQHLILLLAARHMESSLFNHFARQLETLMLVYFLTRVQAKEFERKFSSWAKTILKINSKVELNRFLKESIMPEVEERKKQFENRFMEFTVESMQKYRVRYILSKLAQYVDQHVISNFQDQDLNNYIKPGVEIEHILPENPERELVESIGEQDYNEYKIKLGNLTLLEKGINVSVSNKDFINYKVKEYSKSQFYLTRSIAKLDDVGVDTARNRINKRLKAYDKWDQKSIDERQKMIFELAKDIWKVETL